jgi:tyrosyl-tRNA synthetase
MGIFGFGRPAVVTDEKRIEEALSRGVSEVIVRETLKEKLLSGKRLRIKLGIDPTSPNLHLGRSIPLLKLRDFQDMGHQIVLIVGDFTAVIGDTSDKDAERPMLAREVIEQNMQKYKEQAGRLLDMSKVELRHNSEWLESLDYRQIGEHADLFSVADFIARENIKRRLDDGKRVSLREVLYPLMQGYDSVAVRADVELGGTDQKFNVLAGRPLQENFGQEPQNIVLNPLINGLDGRKMSSSWGNVINLTDEPSDMYGKVMSMRDEQIVDYFTYCTRVPLKDIEATVQGLADGSVHPKNAKMQLAREITTMYHGADAASKAEKNWDDAFSKGKVPENIEEIGADGPLRETLIKNGIITSNSEFTRLVLAGAIRRIDSSPGEAKIIDANAPATPGAVFRVGKHRFVKIAAK